MSQYVQGTVQTIKGNSIVLTRKDGSKFGVKLIPGSRIPNALEEYRNSNVELDADLTEKAGFKVYVEKTAEMKPETRAFTVEDGDVKEAGVPIEACRIETFDQGLMLTRMALDAAVACGLLDGVKEPKERDRIILGICRELHAGVSWMMKCTNEGIENWFEEKAS